MTASSNGGLVFYPSDDPDADERRERIATACLAGMLAADAGGISMQRQSLVCNSTSDGRGYANSAEWAVALADALIAALDGAP